jgi:hypothetical protein
MSKYTFIKEPDPDNWLTEGESTLTVTFSQISLENIVSEFEYFLKGAGFHFEGHLDFVPDDVFDGPNEDDLDDVDQWFNQAREKAKKLDSNIISVPEEVLNKISKETGDPAHPPSYRPDKTSGDYID